MNRRSILNAISLLVLLGAFIAPSTATFAQQNKRPNILFAFADDWGRYASAYAKLEPGGPSDILSTPNFDRVAKNGVLFTNAFVNAPSCTPCRSSLLSGQHFFRTGMAAILQGAIWPVAIPTYPLILKDSGYHIGHTYKVWTPGSPANEPYGAELYSYNRAGKKFNQFSQNVSKEKNTEAAKQKLYNEAVGNFQDFLKDRGPDQPFCYWFGPTNLHRKWTKGSGKTLWGLNPDDLKGKMPPFLPDVHEVREDFADYLGEARAFDTALGLLIEELKRTGEYENTIIIVSGDHGIPGFPRAKCNLYDFGANVPLAIQWPAVVKGNRVVDDFVSLPDIAPTLVEAAGLTPPSVMTATSLMNVLKSNKQGIVDKNRSHVIIGRERHVANARIGQMPYPQRAIRTADYLYIKNYKPERWPMGTAPGHGAPNDSTPSYDLLTNNTFAAFGDLDASPTKAWIYSHPEEKVYFDFAFGKRPAEELYVLKDDPHQIHNRANDKKLANIKKQLEAKLTKILTDARDPRLINGGKAYDKAPYTTSVAPPN